MSALRRGGAGNGHVLYVSAVTKIMSTQIAPENATLDGLERQSLEALVVVSISRARTCDERAAKRFSKPAQVDRGV